MKALLRRPSTYLALPMLLACGATLLTYDLPDGYLDGVLLLSAGALAMLALDALGGARLPPFERFAMCEYAGTREALVAFAFCAVVALFCLLDLALFPIPLLDKPSAYAQMEGGREHIRHLSAWCWVLPPIGLLCARQRGLRYAMVLAGIVFPILVIDRNRIFASLFAVALVLVMRRKGGLRLPWPTVLLLGVVGAVLFAALGMLRSGPLEGVTLPFGALYRESPPGVKWLLLYLTAGPYNFAAMLAKHYHNADFLLNQVVPLRGSIVTAGTGIPLDSPTINVGTEYFPFLLALGPAGAVAAMLGLYAMLVWSARRLRASTSLFSLLIFLRMAYVAAMAPFAPQAYTFMSAGFVALCLLMQLFAAWLPRRPLPFPMPRVDHHAP